MNILKWELKRGFKSLMIWVLFIVVIQFMYSALFPSFAGENSLFSSKLQLLPKAFLKIFGVDQIDFSDILHFFAMQGQIWIFLFATFYLTRLSSSIFVKEEHDKTIEFLLSRPISRDRYVIEKFLSFTVFFVIYDGIITLSLLALFNKYKVKPFDIQLFWKIVLYYWAVHIFMSTVGIVFSVVSRKRTTADTGTFFVLGFSYVLSLIARVYEKHAYLKNFTPFGIFDPADLIKKSNTTSFHPLAFFGVLAIYASSLIFSLYYYRQKDIYI